MVEPMPAGVDRRVARLAAAVAGAASPLERLARHRTDLVPILTYHRVVPAEALADACPSTTSATTGQLRRQLRFIAEHRHALTMDELLRVRRGEQEAPPGSIVVTFDDGYADFAEWAWPALQEHGVPAVLFVPTALISQDGPGFWWDRLWLSLLHTDRPTTGPTPVGELPLGSHPRAEHAHRRLRNVLKGLPHDDLMADVERLVGRLGAGPPAPRLLGWGDLRRLEQEGLAVGSHSATHPLLTRVSPARRAEELVGSLRTLRTEVCSAPPVLAYPGGEADDEVVADAAEAGYEMAFGTRRGVVDVRHADWYRLERINVSPRVSWGALRAQLSPPMAELASSFT